MPQLLSRAEQDHAVVTWRYLRLAMIVLVAGLAAAVVFEVARRDGDCVQRSISAYYYTHAQGIFVGSLLAIGTCLICLRGSTDWEDVLLNVAGMLAPVVALVPTPDAGGCASLPGIPKDPTPNVENNVTALLFIGFLAFVLLAALSWRRPRPAPARIGYGVALALWGVALVVFLVERETFVAQAHGVAAFAMFGCIIAVACVNALSFKAKQDDPDARNRYGFVAVAMLAVPALYVFGGEHRALLAETAALVLFAVFWALQTEELWDQGVRHRGADAGAAAR